MISLNYETPKNSLTPDGTKNSNLLDTIKQNIDTNDIYILSKLNGLRLELSNNNLNLKNIREQIKQLSSFQKTQNFEYLNNLLCPEKSRGCKIPSQIPVPSCSFQLHNAVTVATNASGNCAFICNPCFLADTSVIGTSLLEDTYTVNGFMTTCWVNNHTSLTGNATNGYWTPTNFFQVLPPVYSQYRLVSAALQVRYIGRLDSAAGVIGGAILLDDLTTLGGMVKPTDGDPRPAVAPDIEKYGNFELARDSYYHKDNSCLEGMRLLYFPIDNSYEEYEQTLNGYLVTAETVNNNQVMFVNQQKRGFNWMFYCWGGPQGQNCFKIDLFCNFECLPEPSFLNYMPISAYPFMITPDEKKKCIMVIQNKPILKLNEDNEGGFEVPDIFLKLVNKFKNGLPGFERLRAWGLINAIPGLSSGLALAGNMIATNSMMDYE